MYHLHCCFVFSRSDSEAESIFNQAQEKKARAPPKRKSSQADLSKANEKPCKVSEQDLFGLLSEDDEAVVATAAHHSVTSSLTTKVANGSLRKNAPLEGEYFIELEQDGYVVLENFLQPAECDELKSAGLELTTTIPDSEQRAIFSSTESTHVANKYFMESADKVRHFFEKDAVGPDGKLKVDQSVSLNKVGHALHLLDPIFRCYTYSDRVKAVCRELGLQEPAVVQSMYIYKNPGVGGEVIAHQDATYLYTEPIPPVGFWIALEDATVQNGCLWVARGSHKSGVHRRLKRDPNDSNATVYDCAAPFYPESSFTPVPVIKGTCILLHGLVVHKSAHNKSSASRHAYTFHVVERRSNHYSEDNWLQEGEGAPFTNIYETPQIV